MRARIAATLVSGAAIIVSASAALALLNASSSTIGDWTNARPTSEVRLAAGDGAGSPSTKGGPAPETTGAAPRADVDDRDEAIPVPVPAPKASASKAPPRLAKRAEQVRVQRERRRARVERMRAQAEARRAERERILRRWNEYSGQLPFGGNRRDFAIGRPPQDGFFHPMR